MRLGSIYVVAKQIWNINKSFLEAILLQRANARANRMYGKNYFPDVDEILNQSYVFVLSTGRCGTALITKIFNESSKLYAEHNPKPELEYVSSIIHREGLEKDALKLAVLAARFDLFFLQAYLRGKVYVETNCRISFFAPALADLLPNAKFIHLVRNPADFARSGMRRGYYAEGVVQHQRLDGSRQPDWGTFSRLEKVGWEWNEINRKIEEFKAVVDPNRVITVNSEGLYKAPEVTSDIFRFLEIDNPFLGARGKRKLEKMLERPVNKQISGSYPKYNDWSDADKKALRRIVTFAPEYDYMLDG
jgi:hypothetical protein